MTERQHSIDGLPLFRVGEKVRIGKGQVVWTVTFAADDASCTVHNGRPGYAGGRHIYFHTAAAQARLVRLED